MKRNVQTSDLRSPVMLQKAVSTKLPSGDDDVSYLFIAQSKAFIESQGYREVFAGQTPASVGMSRITMRFRTDLSVNDRIIDMSDAAGRTYQIDSIGDPDCKRFWTEIFARRVMK